MIEVEKKFALTKEQEKNLLKDADFIGEKKFTDTYYDDTTFSLTTKDTWLRKRDETFELKIPLNKSYEEIENEKDILNYFGKDTNKKFEDFLTESEYKPFCEVTTTRRKYKKEGLTIDLDSVDYGYEIMEIELMTDDASKIEQAVQTIVTFAKRHDITKEKRWGKVIEYVRRNNQKHFQALIDANVIK